MAASISRLRALPRLSAPLRSIPPHPALLQPIHPLYPWYPATAVASCAAASAQPQPRAHRLSRPFHTTAPTRKEGQHFDTLRFVQRLRDEGFTEEQAAALMKILNDVMEESMQTLSRSMVPREDAARATYTQKVDFAKLRSELLSADSSESNATRASYDRLANDLTKLNARLRDDINRTLASVRLDLNLEKGRIREEALGSELKMKETEARIDQEVAGLREKLEAVKFQSLQWLIGVCTGFLALMLGAWRLFM